MAGQGKETPIPQGMIAMAAKGLTRIITGADEAWFGPNQPLPPVAQQVAGRQLDYGVGINIVYQPKIYDNDTGISFGQLRAMSEGCEVVRLCIETRKDQMEKLNWSIRPKDDKKDPDTRCDEVQNFFAFPDKRLSWKTWLRVVLEDLLTIDAPALYVRRLNGGKPYALEIMDGSLFKVLVQPDGRRPLPPQPAYQQILKGVPAVDYTSEELLYRPRNPRSHKLYGFSPVEQILTTCNTFIRRALYQLKYYTAGTIPEGFLEAPVTWQQDQIVTFQKFMDRLLAGDLDRRNQAIVVPNGMKFNEAKQPQLTDEMDQWLARIVCYAFSLPPTPFVKQNNRATATTAKDTALEEGLAPLMSWVKELIDFFIINHFGYPDIEFEWDQEVDTDPLIQAQIHQIYLGANTGKQVLTQNEVRLELGKEPIEGGDDIVAPEPETDPNDPNAAPEDDTNADDPKDTTQKADLSKGKKKLLKSKSRTTAVMKQGQKDLTKVFTDFFANEGEQIAERVAAQYAALRKADDADDIADSTDLSFFDRLVARVRVIIQAASLDGAKQAFKQIVMKPSVEMTAQVHTEGVKYAANRAAEMVGKQWIGNVLVDNANAAWVITESTRQYIRDAVERAITEGWSTNQLAADLMSQAFSPARAKMIARTEMLNANIAGNMIAYRESGVVVGKKWLLAELPCDVCKANAAEGVIALDELFISGDDAPPAHPHCECDISPITDASKLGDRQK